MEKALAYVISAGIIGFGFWIIATAKVGLGSLTQTIVGLLPIAVGLLSLHGEMRSDRT